MTNRTAHTEKLATKISAIILAGGQGRRFNGEDKGLIDWRGKPLIQYVMTRLQPQVDQIIISCNRNIARYQQFGHATCQDTLSDFQGPLAGIQAAMPLVKHPLVLVSPCDTTQLPYDLANQLYDALSRNQADVAYPLCNGRSHYLPALIKTDLLPSLLAYLQSSERSVRGWYQQHKASIVQFADNDTSFSNFNYPEDLNAGN
ncbi:MAG: molybdenum cofactor guanylyltransferase MobA [Spongiibacteraceae bacterium]